MGDVSIVKSPREDALRTLIDLGLRYARSRQSAHTHYLHDCDHATDEEKRETIPLVDNVLFALLLFHQRTTESVTEAKALLDNLLHFQGPTGNFPIYLHEFPHSRDRFLGVQLLPSFYWILTLYGQVLGKELKARLEKATQQLLNHCLASQEEHIAPYPIALKIAASTKAIGTFWEDRGLITKGDILLNKLQLQTAPSAWFSPTSLGEILVSLQLLYPSLTEGPWHSFWQHLSDTWYSSACCYVGPGVKEQQASLEPQVTLYDLFLGYFYGTFAERALHPQSVHLQAALIRPSSDALPTPSYPLELTGKVGEREWLVQQNPHYGYSALARRGESNPATEHLQHTFKLVWGSPTHTHTFVCQGGKHTLTTFKPIPNGVEFYFTLAECVSVEEREKSREIGFYFDVQEKVETTVNQQKTNTFKLGERVDIQAGALTLHATFSLEEGEGRFIGHFMRGNRPAQLPLKGSRRFDAYDWQLFLRTLARSSHCKLKVSLQIRDA